MRQRRAAWRAQCRRARDAALQQFTEVADRTHETQFSWNTDSIKRGIARMRKAAKRLCKLFIASQPIDSFTEREGFQARL
jgi:hypothetical protein